MNWEAIGAVGEILGAAGVIITLVYLAVQVRQNSVLLERSVDANRLAADDAITRGFDQWRDLLIRDQDLASLYLRGMDEPHTLDPADQLRFNFILSSFTWTAWQLWRAEKHLGTPNAEILRHLLRHPGGRDWWLQNEVFYPPDFRGAAGAVLADLEREGTPRLTLRDVSSMFCGVVEAQARVGPAGDSH